VDIADEKLELASQLGADAVFNAADGDAVAEVQSQIGGVHGAVITAVSTKAFEQALGMMRRGGTMALNGLPPGSFPLPIFEVVLKGLTVRGSIVGTRMDLSESLAFAADHSVESHFHWDTLDNINGIFGQMQQNKIDGRVVMSV
jgi:propanol-preferring alcohol dehydrogenase